MAICISVLKSKSSFPVQTPLMMANTSTPLPSDEIFALHIRRWENSTHLPLNKANGWQTQEQQQQPLTASSVTIQVPSEAQIAFKCNTLCEPNSTSSDNIRMQPQPCETQQSCAGHLPAWQTTKPTPKYFNKSHWNTLHCYCISICLCVCAWKKLTVQEHKGKTGIWFMLHWQKCWKNLKEMTPQQVLIAIICSLLLKPAANTETKYDEAFNKVKILRVS